MKSITFYTLALISLIVMSCSCNESEFDISAGTLTKVSDAALTPDEINELKLLAWNYLVDQAQTSTIVHTYNKAVVANGNWGAIQTFAVSFSTTDDPLLGPIVVHLRADDKQVVGIAPRF
jgi:hypothetical protein